MQSIIDFHSKLLSKFIHPDYVFDCIALVAEDGTKAHRASIRNKVGQFYLEQVAIVKVDADYIFSSDNISKATVARMKMSHPTAFNHANVLRSMKKEEI